MTPTHSSDTSTYFSPDIEVHMHRITSGLAHRYEGIFSKETIETVAGDSYRQLAENATISSYLPVLTERFANDRLQAQAHTDGLIFSHTPQVLFLCVHNAGRSQMAAAWMHHLSGGAVAVRSAGSAPSGNINPVVTEAMAEVGIELTDSFPKPTTTDIVHASDVIVTMGCGDACPVYPGKRYLDWELPDPAGLTLEQIRPIRDEIRNKVTALINELTPTNR
ncbi:MAG: arsenate reductase ArsC [Candidatus Nanopelagicales bacterium]